MESFKAVHSILEEVLEQKIDETGLLEKTLSEIGLNSMAVLNVIFKIEEYTHSDLSDVFDEMTPPGTMNDLVKLYSELNDAKV